MYKEFSNIQNNFVQTPFPFSCNALNITSIDCLFIKFKLLNLDQIKSHYISFALRLLRMLFHLKAYCSFSEVPPKTTNTFLNFLFTYNFNL